MSFEQMTNPNTVVVPDHVQYKAQYKYCKRNAEKRKETQQSYYQRNKELLKQKSRENYQRNKQKRKAKRLAQAAE